MTILNNNKSDGRHRPHRLHHHLRRCIVVVRNKLSLKNGFWLLLILYMIGIFWSYKTVTELDHDNNTVAERQHRHQRHHHHHHHHKEQKVQKLPQTTARDGETKRRGDDQTTKDKEFDNIKKTSELIHHNNTIVIREAVTISGDIQDNNNNSTSTTSTNKDIHVLILISSVMRKQETICTTIKYALENFLPPINDDEGSNYNFSSSSSSSSSSSMSFVVRTPHILVHRYGEIPDECNFFLSSSNSIASSSTFVTMEQYSKHMHPSNHQQITDYLHLMEHGIKLITGWNNNTKNSTTTTAIPFTHVMFLDDDVTLCTGFCYNILNAIQAFPSTFGMGHFGRGGSGLLIPAEELPRLKETMIYDQSRLKTQPKNVDTIIIDYGLNLSNNNINKNCLLRPTTIQMRHIGLESSMNRKEKWKDIDQCNSPADNVHWKALSESPHPLFFGEHCLYNPSCSPFTSFFHGMNSSYDNCSICQKGYTGDDCGLPIEDVSFLKRRTKNIPPIVSLLDSNKYPNEDVIIENSKRHNLINLFVLGNRKHDRKQQKPINMNGDLNTTTAGWWLKSNIYVSTNNATFAFYEELKYHPRWGQLAWPTELILIHDLMPPEELWSLKYYEPAHKQQQQQQAGVVPLGRGRMKNA